MGSVYAAHDRSTGTKVAVKVLQAPGDREAEERFLREASVLAELRHPGIVRYVAHGRTASGELYLAMQWLEGVDLFDRLGAEPLTVEESVRVIGNVAEALAFAHHRGIVHRDLKPTNIFLLEGDPDLVKLLDFGVARRGGYARPMTRAGVLLGTPGYMAPEQARGTGALGPSADVFALGCVLFECLTGRPPFVAEEMMAVLAKVLFEQPPRLRELRPDLPAELEVLVARMLAKDPEERLQSAAEVRAAIDALPAMSGRAPAAPSIPAPSLTQGEQQLLSIVLVGPTAMGVPTDEASRQALDARIKPFGARWEQLRDGSVLATLGGRGSATDQAAQAARCALTLRAHVTGARVVLVTGRGLLSERWPIGEAIDRAVRTAREGESCSAVRIDALTAGLLDARFDVGGDDEGLVLRAERTIAETTRTVLGRATPCVGRDRELGALRATLAECVGEPVARVVLITGAAGVGKSRLRYELLRGLKAANDGARTLIARGDAISAGSPFGLLAPMLRRAAGVQEDEPIAVRQRKLAAHLAVHLPDDKRERVVEFLCELAGARVAEGSVQLRAARRDPVLMGDQMRRAWEDWLEAECAHAPVILVIEDLQWGDLPTVQFVDGALRHLRERPLMVLALARPEVHELFPALWGGRALHEIRLGELTAKGSEKLVRQVLGERASAEVVARVVERGAGNALYLEELIRAVAEGKGDALPETVLAMVHARLEHLEPEARQILRAASVFGRVFWRGAVTALIGKSTATTVRDWLGELEARELITRRTTPKFSGEDEYVFRHTLTREGAYAMLTDEDRALGHRIAATWLQKAGESDAMVLAEHFERGAAPELAIPWFLQAAEQALEGNDLRAVVARGDRGAACGARGEVLGALRALQAEAHRWLGEVASAETRGFEAMQLVPVGSAVWYRCAGEVAIAAAKRGNSARIVELGETLRNASFADATNGAPVIAAARASMNLLIIGRGDVAAALLRRLDEEPELEALHDPSVAARIATARAYQALFAGNPGETLHWLRLASEAFEEAGDLRNACNQGVNVGYASLEVGRWVEAEASLREAMSQAERMGLMTTLATARQNLGLALAMRGAIDEAREIETLALSSFIEQGDMRFEGSARVYLAKILAMGGDLVGAEREARAADALLAKLPTRAHALSTLARVLLLQGRVDEAAAPAREAMAVLESVGVIEEGESSVRLVDALAKRAIGDYAGARASIAAARARLLQRAEKISDEALRASFLEQVPDNAQTMAFEVNG